MLNFPHHLFLYKVTYSPQYPFVVKSSVFFIENKVIYKEVVVLSKHGFALRS